MNYTLTNTKDAPAAVTLAGTEKLLAIVDGTVKTVTPTLIAALSQPNLSGIGDVPGLTAALAAKANTADLPTNLAADFLQLELRNAAPTPVEAKGFLWIGLGTHPNSWALWARYNTGANYRVLDNLAANSIAGLPMDDDARDFERGVFPVFAAEESGSEGPDDVVYSHYSKEMTVVGPTIGKFWFHLQNTNSFGDGIVIEGFRSGAWEDLWTPVFESDGHADGGLTVNTPEVTLFRIRFNAFPSTSHATLRPTLRVIERL